MAPKVVPKEVAQIKEEELPPASGAAGVVGGVPGGVAGGAAGGVLGGIIGSVPTAAPPPPPAKKEEKPVTPQRIKVGGAVQSARLIRQPKPIYPPLAKQARISGVVHLAAIISKDGTIQHLEVISGHPLRGANSDRRELHVEPVVTRRQHAHVGREVPIQLAGETQQCY
jgi:protein TonB